MEKVRLLFKKEKSFKALPRAKLPLIKYRDCEHKSYYDNTVKICPECGAKDPYLSQTQYEERELARECERKRVRERKERERKERKRVRERQECERKERIRKERKEREREKLEHATFLLEKEKMLQIPIANVVKRVPRELKQEEYRQIISIGGENICRQWKDNNYNVCVTKTNTFMIYQLSKKFDRLQDQNNRLEGLLTEFLDRLEFVPGGLEYEAAEQHFEKNTTISAETEKPHV